MSEDFAVKYICGDCGQNITLYVIEDAPNCPRCGGELKVKKVSKLKK